MVRDHMNELRLLTRSRVLHQFPSASVSFPNLHVRISCTLQRLPSDPDALHLMGLVRLGQGKAVLQDHDINHSSGNESDYGVTPHHNQSKGINDFPGLYTVLIFVKLIFSTREVLTLELDWLWGILLNGRRTTDAPFHVEIYVMMCGEFSPGFSRTRRDTRNARARRTSTFGEVEYGTVEDEFTAMRVDILYASHSSQ